MSEGRDVQEVRFGPIRAHAVSMPEAVDLIARRAASGRGGFVLTPNLDTLAQARRHETVARAYDDVFLSLADGMPLVAAARLLRLPLRSKVSGSDLLEPLMERCAADGLPVYFIGAAPETCEVAVERLHRDVPRLKLLGYDSSAFDPERDPEAARNAFGRARGLGARLVVVFLPTMKTLMLHRFQSDYHPALGIGLGQSLAFYAGHVRRSPRWMSRLGLEWAYRLSQEPGRLWRRYLVEDPQALPVFLGMALDRLRGRPLVRTCRLDTSPLEG
jgi:N-acetylglucosaminyldiphosphoundecaprenol N-acetyl-beta-D-mannosaminyltransferase